MVPLISYMTFSSVKSGVIVKIDQALHDLFGDVSQMHFLSTYTIRERLQDVEEVAL